MQHIKQRFLTLWRQLLSTNISAHLSKMALDTNLQMYTTVHSPHVGIPQQKAAFDYNAIALAYEYKLNLPTDSAQPLYDVEFLADINYTDSKNITVEMYLCNPTTKQLYNRSIIPCVSPIKNIVEQMLKAVDGQHLDTGYAFYVEDPKQADKHIWPMRFKTKPLRSRSEFKGRSPQQQVAQAANPAGATSAVPDQQLQTQVVQGPSQLQQMQRPQLQQQKPILPQQEAVAKLVQEPSQEQQQPFESQQWPSAAALSSEHVHSTNTNPHVQPSNFADQLIRASEAVAAAPAVALKRKVSWIFNPSDPQNKQQSKEVILIEDSDDEDIKEVSEPASKHQKFVKTTASQASPMAILDVTSYQNLQKQLLEKEAELQRERDRADRAETKQNELQDVTMKLAVAQQDLSQKLLAYTASLTREGEEKERMRREFESEKQALQQRVNEAKQQQQLPECSICLDTFKHATVITTCGHMFCESCIQRHVHRPQLASQPSAAEHDCPVCKAKFSAFDTKRVFWT